MAKSISENMLAKKIRIKPVTLRLWRNTFLKELKGVPKSIAKQQGTSLKLGREQVFTIMMVTEIIRHGGSQIDAFDMAQQIGIDSLIGYLHRRVVFVPGSDDVRLTSWKGTIDPPAMVTGDGISLMIINLDALRINVDKILG